MSFVLMSIGSFSFLYGLIYMICIGTDFGVLITIALGLFFLVWGVFCKKIQQYTKSGILKFIKIFVLSMLLAECILLCFLAIYGQNDMVNYKEEVAIVLGAGIHGDRVSSALKQRLDTFLQYYEKNPDVIVVVTGGQGYGETVTEAFAMEKYLVEHGVPKHKIIKEECATSTNENMRFSFKILQKELGEKFSSVIITNGFHMYRSVCYAEKNGITKPKHISAGLKWYNVVPCYLRESLAVIKLWILE